MTKWRPDTWKNPYPKNGFAQPEGIPWYVIQQTFETGADSMLDALVNQTSHPQEVRDKDGKKLGILVFIKEHDDKASLCQSG